MTAETEVQNVHLADTEQFGIKIRCQSSQSDNDKVINLIFIVMWSYTIADRRNSMVIVYISNSTGE